MADPMTADKPGKLASFFAPVRKNLIAYVSLFIAVSGLLYNTWRNETSETQRNLRSASFFAIEHLADFQSLINDIVYSDGCQSGNDIAAWGHIKALETLAGVLPESTRGQIAELGIRWASHASELCPCSERATRRQVQREQEAKEAVLNLIELTMEVEKRLDQCRARTRSRSEQIDQEILFPQVKITNQALIDLIGQLD